MEVVPSRDANTLLPIIQAHTAPGTTTHSNQWRAYNSVSSLPGVTAHRVVNHSLHFLDPGTGVHTQTVESYWNRVKTKLKRMKGCDGNQFPSYLNEFMWRERHGMTGNQALQNIEGYCYAVPSRVVYKPNSLIPTSCHLLLAVINHCFL